MLLGVGILLVIGGLGMGLWMIVAFIRRPAKHTPAVLAEVFEGVLGAGVGLVLLPVLLVLTGVGLIADQLGDFVP
jgi:hypothetical protein